MFPFVYEFHWTPGHIIFLGIFFTVLAVIATTFVRAMLRSRQDFRLNKSDEILWHSDFADLPNYARVCRHELTGEVEHRVCENAFNCGTCEAHRAFLAQRNPEINVNLSNDNMYGFDMPLDRLYHRGHSWVKKTNDGTFLIGIDDFGNRLIGKPEKVSLPKVGSHIKANTPGLTVEKAGAQLRLLSPISGVVIEHGKDDDAWLLKVKPDDNTNGTTHLLRGAEIRPWIMREMERLQISLAPRKIGFTLADGGELLPNMHRHYPNIDWDSVWGEMFLEG